jgi:hypothetical protein
MEQRAEWEGLIAALLLVLGAACLGIGLGMLRQGGPWWWLLGLLGAVELSGGLLLVVLTVMGKR